MTPNLSDIDRGMTAFSITSSNWSTRLVNDMTWEVCRALEEQGFVKDKVGSQAQPQGDFMVQSTVATEFHLIEPVSGRRLLVHTAIWADSREGQLGSAWLDVEVRGDTLAGSDVTQERPVLVHVRAIAVEPMPLPLDQVPTSEMFITHARRGLAKLSEDDMESVALELAKRVHQVLQP